MSMVNFNLDGDGVISRAANAPVFADGDNLADNAKPPDFLINNILESGSHGILGGKSMAFKSFVALDIAHAICTGCDFFGHEVFKVGVVVIVCGEGQAALSRRIKAKKKESGGFDNNLRILEQPLWIDNDTEMERFAKDITGLNPVLVIFDTFSSLACDTKENANDEVAKTLRLVKDSCMGAGTTASLLVHHYGKDDQSGFRGASAFLNNVDFAIEVKRDGNKESMLTEFSCLKQKDGEEFDPIAMKAKVVDLELTRQDGEETTSLVLLPTDEKVTGKAKPLTTREEKGMLALEIVLKRSPVDVPAKIKHQYGGFNFDRKVAFISDWKNEFLSQISSDFEGKEKTKKCHAKRQAFKRARDTLYKKKCAVFDGEYIWPYHYKIVTGQGMQPIIKLNQS